jgi:RHS repeat-associated protein
MTQITNQLNAFSGYRFHFNGKETDNEVYGEGNVYDFGARIYNSRLGRWLSVDAYASTYVSISTYAFCGNTPTLFVDYDGNKFINPYTDKKITAALDLSNAKDAYNNFLLVHPDLVKNPTFFRRLFNAAYREKHELEKNQENAQRTLNELEQKEIFVNNLLYTFEVVNQDGFNYFDKEIKNPDGSNVIIPIFVEDEYRWDGTSADTRIKLNFDEITKQTSFNTAKIKIYFKEGYEAFMNELGDIDYAKNEIKTKEQYNAYYDDSVPYEDRPETIHSYEYESKEVKKFNQYKKENKIKSKQLDERGNLQK